MGYILCHLNQEQWAIKIGRTQNPYSMRLRNDVLFISIL